MEDGQSKVDEIELNEKGGFKSKWRMVFYWKIRFTVNDLSISCLPKFFITIKDDEKLLNKFSNFIIQFKEYWNDIFIILDDENNSFNKEYKNIQKIMDMKIINFIICDLLINSNKSKKIKIDKNLWWKRNY